MRRAARSLGVALALTASAATASNVAPPPSPSAARLFRARPRVLAVVPGQPVAFADPVAHGAAATDVLLREEASGRTWTLPATHPRVRTGGARGVGFVVPQLPRGRYDATCDGQSMTFAITPRLRAPRAVIYGAAGSEAIVMVGLGGPASVVSPRDAHTHVLVRAPVTLAETSGNVTLQTGADGLARFRVVLPAGTNEVVATAPGFEPVTVRLVAGAAPSLRIGELLAGDVLLYAGNAQLDDAAARDLEPPGDAHPPYTHTSVVLGRERGAMAVAEMLATGHRIAPVEVSVEEALRVDVYRWATPLASAKRDAVAVAARGFGIRGLDRYATEETFVLGAARTSTTDDAREDAELVALLAGGELAMTSAEMAVWAYHDAELAPSLAVPLDYATPGALARSPSFAFAFTLK